VVWGRGANFENYSRQNWRTGSDKIKGMKRAGKEREKRDVDLVVGEQ